MNPMAEEISPSLSPKVIYSSPHPYADARMCTAVSGLVTLAEVVKRNTRFMSSCGSQEAMLPKNKKHLPNLPYLSFIHYMKFSSLLPANTVLNLLISIRVSGLFSS